MAIIKICQGREIEKQYFIRFGRQNPGDGSLFQEVYQDHLAFLGRVYHFLIFG
jgi:hypothetical protein